MQFLKENSIVDIVAPASQKCDRSLEASRKLLLSWGILGRAPKDIYGPDLLYANNNDARCHFLKQAIEAPDSNFIWAIRGGCGSTRLLPFLKGLSPFPSKFFIGFSDITALHIFFYQQWSWKTCIHGTSLNKMGLKTVDDRTFTSTKKLVLGEREPLKLTLIPLNNRTFEGLEGPLTGGNLSMLQYSLGTFWQLNADEHILVVEDVDEKPYRTAERLEHMRQAGIFRKVKAIVFADFNFLSPVEPIHESLYPQVLRQFAEEMDCPVFSTQGIGHTPANQPFVYGVNARIIGENGKELALIYNNLPSFQM